MTQLEEASVAISNLLLDPNNFRFQDASDFSSASEVRFGEESVQSRAFARIRSEGLSELKSSIIHNGFLSFERIVVSRYDDNRFLVIEGNRRVAALKWIKQDHDAGVEIPKGVLETLDAVPVIVADTKSDPALALALMGVRHVGGIKPWGGYQRAKLVTELRDQYSLEPSEIASRLGMTAHEVNRRYRAFKALEQMSQDDEYGDVSEPDMYPLFHEAVAGTVIKEWLGWNDENAAFENLENLHQFYELITDRISEDGAVIEAKLQTREAVRDLRDVLPVPEAKRVLTSSGSSFTDALAVAKADSIAKSWVTQVSEAVAALKSVGALELVNLTTDDLDGIRTLNRLSHELLEVHRTLQSGRTAQA